MEKGHSLGFDEVKIGNEDPRNQTAVKWLEKAAPYQELEVSENDT